MAISIGELEAVLKLKDEMSGQLNEAAKSTGLFGSMFQGTMGKAMAVGAGVSAVIVAMEVALVSLANRGSDVNDVSSALDGFTGSAQASNDILAQMKAGTLGTVDSFTLMKESSRLLGAGVDLNAEQFGELSKAAFALQNRGLGPTKDMLALVSDAMVTGRTRAIAMKLGVVDVGDAEVAYANKLGEVKEDLTDLEKTETKRIAVMSLLEKAVKQAGEAHRDFGEELEAASAFVTDFVDDITKGIAASPALSDAVNRISKALSDAFGDERSGAIETVISALESLATTTADVVVFIIKITDEIINFTKFIAENLTILGLITVALVAFASGLGIISIGALAAAAATSIATIATAAFAATMAVLTGPVLLVIAGIAALIAAYKYFGNSTQDASAAAADQAKKLEQNAAASKIAEEATKKLAEQKEADKKASEKQAAAELAHQEVLKASKKIREEQAAALITLRGYTKSYEETLKTIDPLERKQIENHIANGAGLGLLAKAYPKLTEAQLESVQKGIEAEKKRVETIAKVTEDVAKLQQNAADAIEALDADTLANRINHLDAKRQRETEAASQSIADAMAVGFTLQEVQTKQVEAILAIEKKYIALGTAEQRKAADEKNKIVMAGAMLYLSIVKTNTDAAFNLTATDREKSLRAIQQNEIEKLEEIRQKTFESTGLRKLAEDEVRKGSTASVAALKIDNAALTANSKQHFIEVAERSRATYEYMKAHPEKYAKETIEEFKKIAEQTEEPVKGVGVKWKEGFKDIAASIPGIVTQAMTSGGGIVGAMKGIGVMAGAKLGEMLGKSLSALGSMAGPIGAAVGSLAGPLIEMFTKMFDSAAKGIKKTAASYGVTIGDEMAQAIKASMKSNDLTQAAATVFNAIKLFPTIDTTNIDKALKITHDAFSMIETKQLTVAQGGKVVDEMFAKMQKAGTDATGMISKGLLEIITLNDMFGTRSASISAFVTSETQKAVAGLTTFVDYTAKSSQKISEDGATALSGAIVASFVELQKHGMSVTDALNAVEPAVLSLKAQLEANGVSGGAAFERIAVMSALAKDAIAGPALDAVGGLNQAMIGLHNSGILDSEMFSGLAGQVTQTFATLIKGGADGQTAMALMQPSLQTIYSLQKDFGYAVDEATQNLLNQAVEAGIVGEQHRTVEERILDVLNRIAAVFGADIPNGLAATQTAAQTAVNNIQDSLNTLEAPELNVFVNYDQSGFQDGGAQGGLVTQNGIQHLKRGGFVRGYATGTDTVPAMLTPGEAVLTTGAVRSLGTDAIGRLNAGGSLGNDEVINELRLLRKQQAASDRQLPLLVALSVRDAMQLQR